MSWMQALGGGVLIGSAAVLLMASLGRIAGISGMFRGVMRGDSGHGWRLAFLAGLVCAPWLSHAFRGGNGLGLPQASWATMLVAGLLVGVGTALGGGCTSGHGVCGIARLAPRSLAATAVFMLFAMLTVYLLRHVMTGAAI